MRPEQQMQALVDSGKAWKCAHCLYGEWRNRDDWSERKQEHEAYCNMRPENRKKMTRVLYQFLFFIAAIYAVVWGTVAFVLLSILRFFGVI